MAAKGTSEVRGHDELLKNDPGFMFVVHCNLVHVYHRLRAIAEKCIYDGRFPLSKINMTGIGCFGGCEKLG